MKQTHHRRLTLGAWLLIIIIWQLITLTKLIPAVLLPSPLQIAQTFIQLCQHGYNGISLAKHFSMTMLRLLVALSLAVLTAIPLGLLSGHNARVNALIDSFVQFVRPLPPLAYYMILILWLGIGEQSKIMLLYLAAFPPIYLACVSGVRQVPTEYLNAAASLGADSTQIFWHVLLPAALPNIITGIRTATGVAYTTVVAAEMVAATYGIGWMIINASKYLKSDVMFVGIIILGVTGVLIDALLQWLQRRFVYWSDQE
ncbi:ABC transporter permease [Lacticaseibacillus jixiensis]|uniref:ABC transporter permease n=1 Tax=Lacticaseibacillus jixiensis TaxID=3231926 RepID=UPI0036F2E64B